jgi:hypothetical protein
MFGGEGGYERLKAYARAQWETSQFLLAQQGVERVQVYRAVMRPKVELAVAAKEYRDRFGRIVEAALSDTTMDPATDMIGRGHYARLPDVMLKRNGLQSSTLKRDVANSWAGVDVPDPSAVRRAVIRFDVPRTAVLSVPAFGKNVHEEREIVLLGTKGTWKWDVWLDRAPGFEQMGVEKRAWLN